MNKKLSLVAISAMLFSGAAIAEAKNQSAVVGSHSQAGKISFVGAVVKSGCTLQNLQSCSKDVSVVQESFKKNNVEVKKLKYN